MGKVLLVDDSAVMTDQVSSFLQSHQIETLVATNGQLGYELLASNRSIALAIVDVNMPVMDGLSMIEHVRKHIPDCKTQFIMLTTEFDRESKARGRALGVKGWVIKPFKGEMAIGAIKKLLGHG